MTAIAIEAAARKSRPDSQAHRLFNWLACWLVLPNLAFLPVTLMGGPPRAFDILVCAVTGLLLRRASYALRLGGFLTVLTYFAISFISRMFNMSVTMILSVAGLVFDLSPGVSLEYVAAAAMLALTCLAAFWMLRLRADFAGGRWMFAGVAAAIALAGADYAASREAMGSYARLAPAGAAFSSATSQTGLAGLADGRRHVMLVMVEAMGQPTDPRLKARFDEIWARPEFAARFDVVRGETPFFGSTTGGEMRELCQRWGDYPEIDGPQAGCLPARFAAVGYETSAWHAFQPHFFDRERWYPLIGFHKTHFGEELVGKGAGYCPNVFPGACDRDIPALIGKQLAQSHKPQFVYWLTLNSHLPVIEDRQLGTADCRQTDAAHDADFPMVCRIFAMWRDSAEALARMVAREDFPPTDILIVGDHMPPFTHQKSRLQFDPEKVPWILLRYREPSERPAR